MGPCSITSLDFAHFIYQRVQLPLLKFKEMEKEKSFTEIIYDHYNWNNQLELYSSFITFT